MLWDNITHAEITTTDYIELGTAVQYTISQFGDFSPLVFFFFIIMLKTFDWLTMH